MREVSESRVADNNNHFQNGCIPLLKHIYNVLYICEALHNFGSCLDKIVKRKSDSLT